MLRCQPEAAELIFFNAFVIFSNFQLHIEFLIRFELLVELVNFFNLQLLDTITSLELSFIMTFCIFQRYKRDQ